MRRLWLNASVLAAAMLAVTTAHAATYTVASLGLPANFNNLVDAITAANNNADPSNVIQILDANTYSGDFPAITKTLIIERQNLTTSPTTIVRTDNAGTGVTQTFRFAPPDGVGTLTIRTPTSINARAKMILRNSVGTAPILNTGPNVDTTHGVVLQDVVMDCTGRLAMNLGNGGTHTLSGVEFTGSGGTAVVQAGYAGATEGFASNLTMTNCSFTGITNTAVRFSAVGVLTANINGCAFDTAQGATLFGSLAATSAVNVTLTNCTMRTGARMMYRPQLQPANWTFVNPTFTGACGDVMFDLGNSNVNLTLTNANITPAIAAGTVLPFRQSSGTLTLNNCTLTQQPGANMMDCYNDDGGTMTSDVIITINGGTLVGFNGPLGPPAGGRGDYRVIINAANATFQSGNTLVNQNYIGDQFTFTNCTFNTAGNRILRQGTSGGTTNADDKTTFVVFDRCRFSAAGTDHAFRFTDAAGEMGCTFIDPVFTGKMSTRAFRCVSPTATVIVQSSNPANKINLNAMIDGGTQVFAEFAKGTFIASDLYASKPFPGSFFRFYRDGAGMATNVTFDRCELRGGSAKIWTDIVGTTDVPVYNDHQFSLAIWNSLFETAEGQPWAINLNGDYSQPANVMMAHNTWFGKGDTWFVGGAATTPNLNLARPDVLAAHYSIFDAKDMQTCSTTLPLTGMVNLVNNGAAGGFTMGQPADTVAGNPNLDANGRLTLQSNLALFGATGSAWATDLTGGVRPQPAATVPDLGAVESPLKPITLSGKVAPMGVALGVDVTGWVVPITLKGAGGNINFDATLAADGSFSHFMNAPGTVDVYTKFAHWLGASVKNVDANDTVNFGTLQLVNGDADGDNQVTLFDYLVLDGNFGGTDFMADLDADGQVTLFDYLIIDAVFGARGE